jgi:GWxTD domain-containing protein
MDAFDRSVSAGERRDLWDRFWERRRRDPEDVGNAVRAEFFRRVRHANVQFYSAGMEGWRTDRGRIYIKLGPPDQVDESPVTAYQPAYQVWRYYDTRAVFVFADRDGFGRYVLVSANRPE